MPIQGRNLITGLPESIEVSSVEIREALANSVNIIVDTVRDAVDETPPELIADLMEQGIALAGGGALLQGLDQRLVRRDQDAGLCGRRCHDLRSAWGRQDPRGSGSIAHGIG